MNGPGARRSGAVFMGPREGQGTPHVILKERPEPSGCPLQSPQRLKDPPHTTGAPPGRRMHRGKPVRECGIGWSLQRIHSPGEAGRAHPGPLLTPGTAEVRAFVPLPRPDWFVVQARSFGPPGSGIRAGSVRLGLWMTGSYECAGAVRLRVGTTGFGCVQVWSAWSSARQVFGCVKVRCAPASDRKRRLWAAGCGPGEGARSLARTWPTPRRRDP
jgi:hypothetical protein